MLLRVRLSQWAICFLFYLWTSSYACIASTVLRVRSLPWQATAAITNLAASLTIVICKWRWLASFPRGSFGRTGHQSKFLNVKSCQSLGLHELARSTWAIDLFSVFILAVSYMNGILAQFSCPLSLVEINLMRLHGVTASSSLAVGYFILILKYCKLQLPAVSTHVTVPCDRALPQCRAAAEHST